MNEMLFIKKRNSILYLFLMLISMGFILNGCVPEIDPSHEETPTTIPTDMPTATPTPEPTITSVQLTTTITPTDAEIIPSELPPGQYIVYCSFDELSPEGLAINSLFAIDTQGNFHGRLVYDACRSAISHDGKNVVIDKMDYSDMSRDLRIINLESHEENALMLSGGCSQASWAPNGKFIVAACENNINVISLEEDFVYVVDNCEDRDGACGSPIWSPNGEAIVYEFLRPFSTGSGVYFINTNCFDNQGECERLRLGSTLNLGTYSWAPDSKQIAAPNYPESITLLQFPSGSIELLDFIARTTVRNLAWSPDGELLAVTTGLTSGPLSQVYLVNVASGTYSGIGDRPGHKSVMFWLNVD